MPKWYPMPAWLSMWMLGIQISTLTHAQQELYPPSSCPSPSPGVSLLNNVEPPGYSCYEVAIHTLPILMDCYLVHINMYT